MMMIAQIKAGVIVSSAGGVNVRAGGGAGVVTVICGGGVVVTVIGGGAGSAGTATVKLPIDDQSLSTGSSVLTLQKYVLPASRVTLGTIAVVATCSLTIGTAKAVPSESWNSYMVAPVDGLQENAGVSLTSVAPAIGEPIRGTIAAEGATVKLRVSEKPPLNGSVAETLQ